MHSNTAVGSPSVSSVPRPPPSKAVPNTAPALHRAVIFLIAGWSGFYVMGIELLTGRVLAPAFGSSVYTWGSIISLYLLALSIGYLVGGRLSLRNPSLSHLSLLLLLACGSTLPVILAGDAVVDAIALRVHDPRYGSLLSTAILFFLPAAVSGTISPYAVRLLVRDPHTSGQSAGLLYFVSTFGSGAGTLGTSFFFVAWWEVSTILLGLIVTSAILGAASLIVGSVHRARA